jgi:hypothetical protein
MNDDLKQDPFFAAARAQASALVERRLQRVRPLASTRPTVRPAMHPFLRLALAVGLVLTVLGSTTWAWLRHRRQIAPTPSVSTVPVTPKAVEKKAAPAPVTVEPVQTKGTVPRRPKKQAPVVNKEFDEPLGDVIIVKTPAEQEPLFDVESFRRNH